MVVNCAQYHGRATVPQEKQEFPTIVREPPKAEIKAESHAKLKAKASETLQGFAGGFLENTGQKNAGIHYYARSSQLAVGFGISTLWFSISGMSQARSEPEPTEPLGDEELLGEHSASTIVSITFPGSNPVVPLAEAPTGAYNNYYRGADPTQWSTHNPYYTKLVYRNLYEHIDLVYELREGQLKYEFIVNPGGNPAAIRAHWNGPVVLSHQAELSSCQPRHSYP
jgi:hypothetical protein